MSQYYADRAQEYERIYDKPERQEDLRRLREILGHSFAGANVFEVACGTGYWTEVIAHSALFIFATDVNEEVLALARTKPIPSGKVEFQQRDAFARQASARQFDAGFAGFWWSHIPTARIRDFLMTFHRSLEPGARVLMVDNVYVESSSTPIARRDEHGDTYQIRQLQDGRKYEVLKNFPNESELRNAVNGLATDVKVDLLPYYWILSYCANSSTG